MVFSLFYKVKNLQRLFYKIYKINLIKINIKLINKIQKDLTLPKSRNPAKKFENSSREKLP